MTMAMLKTIKPDFASKQDKEALVGASRALATFSGRGCVRVEASTDNADDRQTFVLPAYAVRMVTDMLTFLADGRAVSVMPENALLTTQQAATLLGVSRPHLVSLLEKGTIPFEKVGTHRRILISDLLAYRQARKAEATAILDDMAAEAQELGMGY
ncbi:helix-turn-helix domain-containing protein [Gluconobacter sp. R75690]|nr:helix-turn-helix domain-containing protein [Gluconobacter sp. R75690]MBF0879720.1 helix-turn-helix domain-containing protein [Gluconobacter sp. R75828]